MENIENQKTKSSKDILLERISARFPDKLFNGQVGQDGQIVQDSKEDLEQAIIDMFNEYDGKIAENRSKNDKLVQLMCSDPKCAEFVQKWIEEGDPRAALVEAFGDDLVELAEEEGRMKFKKNLETWREKKAEEEKLTSEADANWVKSLEDLESWGNEKGLDNDQKAKIIGRLMTITANGLMNKYLPEDFETILKDTNFDNAVQAARRDGVIQGRNEKIKAEHRISGSVRNMPPALAGGQGMRVEENRPRKDNPWAGIK